MPLSGFLKHCRACHGGKRPPPSLFWFLPRAPFSLTPFPLLSNGNLSDYLVVMGAKTEGMEITEGDRKGEP